jgi:hypothetical protein
VLAVDAALGHVAVQYLGLLLALAAADNLADPRRQYVHHRDRLTPKNPPLAGGSIQISTYGPNLRRSRSAA